MNTLAESGSVAALGVLLVIACITGGMLWSVLLGSRADEAKLRERAMNQFRSTKAAFPSHQVEFDGQRAEILDSRETKYLAAFLASNYVLTISARMPDGAEFEFKSDSEGKPWVICRSRNDAHAVRVRVAF